MSTCDGIGLPGYTWVEESHPPFLPKSLMVKAIAKQVVNPSSRSSPHLYGVESGSPLNHHCILITRHCLGYPPAFLLKVAHWAAKRGRYVGPGGSKQIRGSLALSSGHCPNKQGALGSCPSLSFKATGRNTGLMGQILPVKPDGSACAYAGARQ